MRWKMDSTFEALSVGLLVALLVIFATRFLCKSKLSLPPGPTPWPLIGSLHLLGTHPHRALADLARTYNGPLMSIRLGQRLCVVASSPEAAKELLKVQDANFCSRPPLRSAQLILPQDIVLQDLSPEIRYMRKLLVSELMNAKRLEASRPIRTEEIAFMLRRIASQSSSGSAIQLRTHLNTVTNNILMRMIFSQRFLGAEQSDAESGADIQEFLAIVAEETVCFTAVHVQDFFNVPAWFDPQKLDDRFRRLRARMDVFYARMIAQHTEARRRNPDAEKNLLDVLLQQLEDPYNVGITDDHVKGVIWDALSAGTDTTVVTSEWAMAEVLRNPHVVSEARAELDRVVGPYHTVQEADIPNLPYIQAIIKETFRLHPGLPMLIPHFNTAPAKVFDYDVPANARVFVNVWALGRDARVWEHPLEFQPERFMSGGPAVEFQGQHFELLPFGSGRRMCPGHGFASVAVQLQVANLLHGFEWSLSGEVDMTEAIPRLTLPKRDPLVAFATPRLPSQVY